MPAAISLSFSLVARHFPMSRRSFLAELFDFIVSHKAYFIAPIILVLLLVGVLIVLGGTKAAPFIYTLF